MTTSSYPGQGREQLNRDEDTPLPRPTRQRQRAKADRGLPPDAELTRLAAEYLRLQRKHWPELLKAGLLPDAVRRRPCRDGRGLQGPTPHRQGGPAVRCGRSQSTGPKLAGSYNRYCCDNSSPKSIIDQLVNALEKARQEDRFVPWAYVFADYSVSGLNPSRQGYASYKGLLQDKTISSRRRTSTTSRGLPATRSSGGGWLTCPAGCASGWSGRPTASTCRPQLGHDDLGVRPALAAVHQGAAGEGQARDAGGGAAGNLPGQAAARFHPRARRDDDGNIVRDTTAYPNTCPASTRPPAADRGLLYELFVEKCWSVYQIARHFNAHKVDGWGGWTGGSGSCSGVPSAVGVFIWNRPGVSTTTSSRSGSCSRTRGRSGWCTTTRTWPSCPWTCGRRPARGCRPCGGRARLTGRTVSRNQKRATTLFSGTLFCGSCGREITLLRSAGQVQGHRAASTARTGSHGCTLSSSKSTRIVEKSLLGYIGDRLLTDEAVEELVEAAERLPWPRRRQSRG